MAKVSTLSVQLFEELKSANSALLRSMAREKRASVRHAESIKDLLAARRQVKLLLGTVQPELSLGGALAHDEVVAVGVAGAALAGEGVTPEYRGEGDDEPEARR